MARTPKPTRDIKWVQTMDDDYLFCRSLRHQWNMTSFKAISAEEAKRISAPEGTKQIIKRELECQRCPTSRFDFFARTKLGALNGDPFIKIRSWYGYPDGYLFDRTEHKLDRPELMDFHKETLRRATG